MKNKRWLRAAALCSLPAAGSADAPSSIRRDDEPRDRRGRLLRRPDASGSTLLAPSRAESPECGSTQQPFVLNFQTDGFGRETSWSLRLRTEAGRANVGSGPPDGVSYGDLTIYSYRYCLDRGETYTLSMEDNFGDGMCCDRGYGGYEFSLGETLVYSSDFEKTFSDYAEHTFTVGEVHAYTRAPSRGPTSAPVAPLAGVPSATRPTAEPDRPTLAPTSSPVASPSSSPSPPPTSSPSASPSARPTLGPTDRPTPGRHVLNPANGCYGGDVRVKVEVRADEFSNDTSWEIVEVSSGNRMMHTEGHSFGQYEYQVKEKCLPHGLYNFTIRDEYGDGICCRYGEGFFRVSLDDRAVLSGGSFNADVTEALNVGYDPSGLTTRRESDYLEAHNARRGEWYGRYNLTHVPLRYSPALAETARAWAEELLHACGVVGIEHESFNPFGENLAKNVGNGDTWGRLYSADSIVGRWVEFEVGLPYPSNGHLTQVLWRASNYLGCGESVKPFRDGFCRVQVCRYGRAGNCDMQGFNAHEGENWLVPMLKNYTRCGPNCPPEGCF